MKAESARRCSDQSTRQPSSRTATRRHGRRSTAAARCATGQRHCRAPITAPRPVGHARGSTIRMPTPCRSGCGGPRRAARCGLDDRGRVSGPEVDHHCRSSPRKLSSASCLCQWKSPSIMPAYERGPEHHHVRRATRVQVQPSSSVERSARGTYQSPPDLARVRTRTALD